MTLSFDLFIQFLVLYGCISKLQTELSLSGLVLGDFFETEMIITDKLSRRAEIGAGLNAILLISLRGF
jgi:hypothetical protein